MATHDYVYDADDPEIQLKTTHPTKDQASSPITLDQSEKGSPRTTRARMEDEPSYESIFREEQEEYRNRRPLDDNYNAARRYHTASPSPSPYIDMDRRNRFQPQLDFPQVPNLRPQSTMRVKPDPYDGSEDWDVYETHFECCALLGKWNQTEKILMLSAMLKGNAKKYYMGLSGEVKVNFASLVAHLRQRFGSNSKHEQFWLNMFDSRVRQPTESPATLGDDLIMLARRAYPEMSDPSFNRLALQQFYKSLEPEMKWRCIEKNCDTVGEAVEVVETFETIMKPPMKRSVRAAEVTREEDSGDSMVMQQILQRVQTLEMSSNQVPAPPVNTRPGYTRPGYTRPGYTNTNTDRFRTYAQGPSFGKSLNPVQPDIKCFLCDQPGHLVRFCPKLKKCKETLRAEDNGHRNGNPQGNGNLPPQ